MLINLHLEPKVQVITYKFLIISTIITLKNNIND